MNNIVALPKNVKDDASRQKREYTSDDYIDWPEKTKNGPKGRSQDNIMYFLLLKDIVLTYNAMSHEVIIHRDGKDTVMQEASFLAMWLEADKLGLQSNDAYFQKVVENIARRNSFHPLRDYLDGCQSEWDKKPRLDTWLHTYLGSENTKLNSAFGRKTLIAAVRRIRQPGTKFDTILILEGKQGTEKSTAIKTLCPDDKYFSDNLTVGASAKEIIEQTAGKWLVELPELDGMGKQDVRTVKSMASRTLDSARLAYGRMRVDRERQFILMGTVNDSQYLRDTTGNRRFWPVKAPKCEIEAIKRDRDQLWAEAAYYEAQGESLVLPQELWGTAAEEQEKRLLVHPWYDILSEHLHNRDTASSEAIYEAVGLLDKSKRTGQAGQTVSQILGKLGFERYRITGAGYAYRKLENSQ